MDLDQTIVYQKLGFGMPFSQRVLRNNLPKTINTERWDKQKKKDSN